MGVREVEEREFNIYFARMLKDAEKELELIDSSLKTFELAEVKCSDCHLEELKAHRRVLSCLKLTKSIAVKYQGGDKIDEIFSVAEIGLIKAAHTFDESKGFEFTTYAGRCVKNEILMYKRWRKNKASKEVSMNEPISTDKDGDSITIEDIITTDFDLQLSVENKMLLHKLSKVLKGLTPMLRTIAMMRIVTLLVSEKRPSQYDVADELGIEQSYVSRLEKKVIKDIRKELEKKDKVE